MPVTIRQIAQDSGMSIPTVSQILNGKGWYRDDTRRRVLDVASRLGYRPNVAARSTRMGSFGAVALLLGTEPDHSTLPTQTMRGVMERLGDLDLQLMVTMLPDEKLTSEGFVPRILRQSMSDGLLINYTHDIPARMVQLIEAHHVPSIWMNARLTHDCICPDDRDAGRRATQHLLALGHRRIAFADGSGSTHYSVQERFEGYVEAMRQAGLVAQRWQGGGQGVNRLTLCKEWLALAPRPSAVVSYGATTTDPLLHVAMALGLRLPEEFSVVQFGGSWICRFAHMKLTTVIVPEQELGRQAVDMLIRRIQTPSESSGPAVVPFGFEPGESCAACLQS